MQAVSAVLTGALVVAGCLGPTWPRGTWAKPGVGPEQRLRDQYECERHAITRAGPDRPAEQLYAECMRARGYEPAP